MQAGRGESVGKAAKHVRSENLHHPQGDHAKASDGTLQDLAFRADLSSDADEELNDPPPPLVRQKVGFYTFYLLISQNITCLRLFFFVLCFLVQF